MNLRIILAGILASCCVLLILSLASTWTKAPTDTPLKVRPIETVIYTPPPPPPAPPESDTPAEVTPPPAITSAIPSLDLSLTAIPVAQAPMELSAPVENFFTDIAPPRLPAKPKATKVTKASPKKSTASVKAKITPKKTTYKAPPKSHYSPSELDSKPRPIRHGSAKFPSSLARRGITRGTVVLRIEILTSGAVRIQRTVSSTHPDLVSQARRVASGARFTTPTKNGRPVKVIMNWPITIKK